MVQCNYLVEEVFSPKVLLEQGVGKIGAEVLYLNIGIPINICTELNICSLNAPTSPIPKPLPVIA
jgi:hypothetical protein